MSYLTPTNQKPGSLFNQLTRRIHLVYYRYEVTYGLYVMSPGEKWVLNGFVLTFLSFLILALYFYLPDVVSRLIQRLFWVYSGSPKLGVDIESIPEAFKAMQSNATMETFKALQDNATMNILLP